MAKVPPTVARWWPAPGHPLPPVSVLFLVKIGLTVGLAAATVGIGVELAGIERLAQAMHRDALPEVIAQQKRAIWTESLRSAADVVVYASDAETRDEALAKADQLAGNLLRAAAPAKRAAVEDGLAAIHLAARATATAAELDRRIKAMLAEANDVVRDMSANLASIVEDSAGTLARLLREVIGGVHPDPPTREDLEEVLAINTTSQDLLASLGRGRILLTAARTMERPEELERAAARFAAVGEHLRARVGTLRGNSDYEYLPDMIERFVALAPVFPYRQAALRAEAQALASSAEAKRRLAVLRENLAADAASRAEMHVAAIVDEIRDIQTTVAAAFSLTLLLGTILWARNRLRSQRGGVDGGRDWSAGGTADRPDAAPDQTLDVLRQLHLGLENLQHCRDHLPYRLRATAHAVLERISGRAAPDSAGATRSGAAFALDEARQGAKPSQAQALPAAVEDRVARLVDAIWSLAQAFTERSHEATLTAFAEVTAASSAHARGCGADPSRWLDMLATSADEAVACIGATVRALNQLVELAGTASAPGESAAIARMVDALDGLGDDLARIRGRLLEPAAPAVSAAA